mgnify:CR=1 FL=1
MKDKKQALMALLIKKVIPLFVLFFKTNFKILLGIQD